MTQSDSELPQPPGEGSTGNPQRETQSSASPAKEAAKLSSEAEKKCKDQEKDCREIAAAFYIWSESFSRKNAAWLIATVFITVVTMVQMLLALGGDQTDLITGTLILVTAVALAGYFALNRPVSLDEIRDAANQFVGLSDQFEHIASIGPKKPDESTEELMTRFYDAFAGLLAQKSRVWQAAPLAPEWCFRAAQERSRDVLPGGGPDPQSPASPGMLRRIRSWLSLRSEPERRPPAPA